MTEADARQRWCPFARLDGANRAPDIQGVMGGPIEALWLTQCQCIASACMAWQWTEPSPAGGRVDHPRRGECGLARSSGWRP